MSVHYLPDLTGITPEQPFRFWCQKVLPLVYDDSLSYYELLCKVVNYLNNTMQDVNTLAGDITAIANAYTQLETYVNDYFDNLDVQEEINNKLDSMAEDGTLTSLIAAYVDPFIDVQNTKIDNLITDTQAELARHNLYNIQTRTDVMNLVGSPLVANSIAQITDTTRVYVYTGPDAENYLNGHWYYYNGSTWADGGVYNSEGLETDTTLSVSGKAADAKVTGDDIRQIVATLEDDVRPVHIDWLENGYVIIQGDNAGNIATYDNWKYTNYINLDDMTHSYFYTDKTPENADGNVYNAYYDKDYNFISSFATPGGIAYFEYPTNAKYMRISCRTPHNVIVYNTLHKDQALTKPLKFYYFSATAVITDYLPLTEAKYIITPPAGYLISYRIYNAGLEAIGANQPYRNYVEIYNLNGGKYIKIYAKRSDEGDISIHDRNLDNITFEEKVHYQNIDYLKVMEFNVGLWHDGVTKQPDATADAYAKAFRRFLGEWNPDIALFLEALATINVSGTYGAPSLYSYKLPFNQRHGDFNIITGKKAFTAFTPITFESGSGRYAFYVDVPVAGKTVRFYNVHLSTEANSTGIRQEDLAEILTWLQNNEYCVVMGDFNTFNMSELSIFDNYNIANGGMFGEFITWPGVSQAWPNGAIDNLICTKNISIQSVQVADVNLSDHKPLVVELSLYY